MHSAMAQHLGSVPAVWRMQKSREAWEEAAEVPHPSPRKLKPGTRDPKPETRDPKPETRDLTPETRNPKAGAGQERVDAGAPAGPG